MNKTLKITVVTILALALVFSLTYAKSKHARLGVLSQTVNNEIADSFDLKINYGAVIKQVVEESPAEQAGLQENDVIIEINGSQINDTEDLVDYIYDSEIGAKLSITLMRGDEKITNEVILDEKPEKEFKRKIIKKFPHVMLYDDDNDYSEKNRSFNFDFDWDDYNHSNYIGILISDISNQLRTFFGVKEDIGVLIGHVNENTPAEKAGLKAGDVIISVDDKEVANNIDVMKIIDKKEVGEKVKITVIRNKEQKSFMVEVEKLDDEHDYFYKYYAPNIDIKIPNCSPGHHNCMGEYIKNKIKFEDLGDYLNNFNFEMKSLNKEEITKQEKEKLKQHKEVLKEILEELKEINEKSNN